MTKMTHKQALALIECYRDEKLRLIHQIEHLQGLRDDDSRNYDMLMERTEKIAADLDDARQYGTAARQLHLNATDLMRKALDAMASVDACLMRRPKS